MNTAESELKVERGDSGRTALCRMESRQDGALEQGPKDSPDLPPGRGRTPCSQDSPGCK